MLFKPLVLDFLRDHVWQFVSYMLIIIVFFPIESILLPKVYGKMFDQIKTITKFSDIYNFRANFSKMNFPGALVLLIVLWVVILSSSTLKTYAESLLTPDYFSYLRNIIFKNTVHSYQSNYNDMKTGDYLTRVLELTRNIKDLFQYIISRFLPELVVSFVIIIYMFMQHKTLGYILLFGSMVCLIVQYFGSSYLFTLISDRESFFNSTVSENLRDSLDNLMNIFLNNEVDNEVEKNKDLERQSKEKLQHIMRVQSMVTFCTDMTIVGSFAVSLIFLYYLISIKKVKVTHGIVLVMILGQFLNNFLFVNNGFIYNIVYRLGIINSSHEFLENIFRANSERTLTSGIKRGHIEFKNVKFRYDKTKDSFIYDNLNIVFEAGKRHSIVGQSGAGKSTMMKLLVGLYTPESGAIYIDSVDTKHMKLDYLRENVNYINQRTNLFNDTIMYNILYGNKGVDEKTVISMLKNYDLLKIFDEIPGGVYAKAGINGGNLSGGMQRIVILMRGILKPGQIIIMDEPTTGLDTNTLANVKKMIIDETEGKTLIIITHENSMKIGEVHEL